MKSRYPDAESRRRDEERLAACRNRYAATAGNDLRRWEKDDIVPTPDDIFQERLYCIQWSRADGTFFYAGVTERDEERERQVTVYVQERLADWQAEGLVPDLPIEPGDKTDEPIRTRGWTYWHHLFNPRHLLIGALIRQEMTVEANDTVGLGIALGYCATVDRLSRLTQWRIGFAGSDSTAQAADSAEHVNQALNTFYNYGSRASLGLWRSFSPKLKRTPTFGTSFVRPSTACEFEEVCDLWISDPPYADAI